MSSPCREFFFLNDTAPTEIYTLSRHGALPISRFQTVTYLMVDDGPLSVAKDSTPVDLAPADAVDRAWRAVGQPRSEEHTSELQSRQYLVCRLLLEKKKKRTRCLWQRRLQ